ncbi:MAG TPA: glycosyltransferase family 39 protein [Trebonia sp.]|nr:glycosyltransferase family 39 protein [Trebonia sp.]
MILSSPGILSHPRSAAEPALDRRPRQWAPRAAQLAAALIGLVAIGAYLFVALRRLDYPFALEQLEGNSLIEVRRILAGQSLYPAPSVGYVPDGYPPLYFYVSAAVARVLGASYLTLRLVSLASSLACFALLARLVQRETGSIAAGTGAAGVFAATYFVAGDWFDVGRVDSLFLALSIGGLYAVRRMRGTPGAIAAGTLLAAAALTKQTALAELVAVSAVLMLGPRRRLARITAITAAAIVGLSTLLLRLASGGWYTYYTIKQMSEHSLTVSNFGWFWTALATALGLAACAALIGARRVPRELLAGCAALAVEGYATLVHSGGAINDVLPAYLAVALLAGLALGNVSARWVTTVAGVLILAQSVFLLASSHPFRGIPASSSAVAQRLIAGMRALGGDVAVPSEPSLSLQAGMTPAAVPGAVFDVVRATDKTGIASYLNSADGAVKARQFSAIISPGAGKALYGPPHLLDDYQECLQSLPAGPATVLIPVAGDQTRPAVVWIPRGDSCQHVLSILGGGKEASS